MLPTKFGLAPVECADAQGVLVAPRRYSTMTTCPVPQRGHSLVSCELHIGAFSGFAQSMNCTSTLTALFCAGASPTGLPLHLVPKILAVAKPLTLTVLTIGCAQLLSTTGTRYLFPTRQFKSLHTLVIPPLFTVNILPRLSVGAASPPPPHPAGMYFSTSVLPQLLVQFG